jgi:hypothetical protein
MISTTLLRILPDNSAHFTRPWAQASVTEARSREVRPMSDSDSKRLVGQSILDFARGARVSRPELKILRDALDPAAPPLAKAAPQAPRGKLGALLIRLSTRGQRGL